MQMAAVDAVRFKCNVLWAQLDALHHAYVTPALIPPGAFRPGSDMSDYRQSACVVAAGVRRCLPRHIKLRRDEARDRWTFWRRNGSSRPTPIAVAMLQLCDGRSTSTTSPRVGALPTVRPRRRILGDVVVMLRGAGRQGCCDGMSAQAHTGTIFCVCALPAPIGLLAE